MKVTDNIIGAGCGDIGAGSGGVTQLPNNDSIDGWEELIDSTKV